jgi:hypothetical protein
MRHRPQRQGTPEDDAEVRGLASIARAHERPGLADQAIARRTQYLAVAS